VHDGRQPLRGSLGVRVHDLDAVPVADASIDIEVPAAGSATVDTEAVLGGFRDLNHAHAFGPPRYDVLHAELLVDGAVRAEVTHLLLGPARPRLPDAGLAATVVAGDGGFRVEVTTREAAQRVAFDVPGFVPDVGWFHLAPGAGRSVRLHPHAGTAADAVPHGTVRALNARRTAPVTARVARGVPGGQS
ncbi:MAG: glycoside hydrolase family 2 protein, partial [Mycobacteriales bacterium]